MATYQNKIMARSPYYITAQGLTYILSAELKVWIWSNDKTSRPTLPNYTISKDALTTTSLDITFEISSLIRDYFDHRGNAYDLGVGAFTDALWVETELSVFQTTNPQPTPVNNLYIALDGFGYFNEGVNTLGSYVTTNTLNVLDGQNVKIPIYANTDGIDELKTYLGGVLVATIDYTTDIASVYAYDKVQLETITDTIDEIRLYNSSILKETIAVNYLDECKYTPKVIGFINKNGLLQEITMFKKSIEKIKVQKKNYNSITGKVTAGNYGYNIYNHQFKDYNLTARESIALNSGFVNELENEVFRQIMLSERVWIDKAPVNVESNSLTYQTRANDKNINYTLEFTYANYV
jgi:hypothetical protein